MPANASEGGPRKRPSRSIVWGRRLRAVGVVAAVGFLPVFASRDLLTREWSRRSPDGRTERTTRVSTHGLTVSEGRVSHWDSESGIFVVVGLDYSKKHVVYGLDVPTEEILLALTFCWPIGHYLCQSSRRTSGTCRRCGYDLRASPGRCPECGLVASPRSPVPAGLDDVTRPL